MEKNILTITVTIEKEIETGVRVNYEIRETIFTVYSHLFDTVVVKDKVKKGIALLKGFSMLTISLIQRPDNDFLVGHQNKLIEGRRFVMRGEEITTSREVNSSFSNWRECNKNEVYNQLNDFVEKGNKAFIALLKGEEVNV